MPVRLIDFRLPRELMQFFLGTGAPRTVGAHVVFEFSRGAKKGTVPLSSKGKPLFELLERKDQKESQQNALILSPQLRLIIQRSRLR
jgi:hypothetical protein